jgi:NitT/TauT family transport system substrate-binding protein
MNRFDNRVLPSPLHTPYLVVFIATLMAVVTGCSDTATVEKLTGRVVIGAYEGDTAALVWIAQERGFFKQVGLDVDIKPYSAGKLAADALSRDEVDLATSAEFVFVKKSFEEKNLRVLGSIATASINWLVANSDKGITQPTDLKGKRVGVTLGSTGEFFLGRILSTNNLSFEDISVVDLPPPMLVTAMTQGDIDAALTWQPNIYHIQKQLGSRAAVFEGQEGQDFYFILMAKNTWVDNHPEHAEQLMRALNMAELWLIENPDAGRQMVMDRFKLGADYLKNIWPHQQHRLSFPQALMIALDAEKRWLLDTKLVESDFSPDFLDYIHPAALAEVKSSVVTVVK